MIIRTSSGSRYTFVPVLLVLLPPVFFISLSVQLVSGLVQGAVSYSELAAYGIALTLCAITLYVVVLSTVTADPDSQTLRISHGGLFGQHRSQTTLRRSDIKAFEVVLMRRRAVRTRARVYQLSVTTHDGRSLPLHRFRTSRVPALAAARSELDKWLTS